LLRNYRVDNSNVIVEFRVDVLIEFVSALKYNAELSHLSLDASLEEEMLEELLDYNYTLKVFGCTDVEEIRQGEHWHAPKKNKITFLLSWIE
jgi:hypothetical protein